MWRQRAEEELWIWNIHWLKWSWLVSRKSSIIFLEACKEISQNIRAPGTEIEHRKIQYCTFDLGIRWFYTSTAVVSVSNRADLCGSKGNPCSRYWMKPGALAHVCRAAIVFNEISAPIIMYQIFRPPWIISLLTSVTTAVLQCSCTSRLQ
jgi:hypothetical protein